MEEVASAAWVPVGRRCQSREESRRVVDELLQRASKRLGVLVMAEKLQRAVPYGGCFGVAFREPADAVEDRPRRGLKRLRHLGRALQRGANCLSARLKRRVCELCDDLIIWRGLDRGKFGATSCGASSDCSRPWRGRSDRDTP